MSCINCILSCNRWSCWSCCLLLLLLFSLLLVLVFLVVYSSFVFSRVSLCGLCNEWPPKWSNDVSDAIDRCVFKASHLVILWSDDDQVHLWPSDCWLHDPRHWCGCTCHRTREREKSGSVTPAASLKSIASGMHESHSLDSWCVRTRSHVYLIPFFHSSYSLWFLFRAMKSNTCTHTYTFTRSTSQE